MLTQGSSTEPAPGRASVSDEALTFWRGGIAPLYGRWLHEATLGAGVVRSPVYRIERTCITADFLADPSYGSIDGSNDCFSRYGYRVSRIEHQDIPSIVDKYGTANSAYRKWQIHLDANKPVLFGGAPACKGLPICFPEIFVRIDVDDYGPSQAIDVLIWYQCDIVEKLKRLEEASSHRDIESCFATHRERKK